MPLSFEEFRKQNLDQPLEDDFDEISPDEFEAIEFLSTPDASVDDLTDEQLQRQIDSVGGADNWIALRSALVQIQREIESDEPDQSGIEASHPESHSSEQLVPKTLQRRHPVAALKWMRSPAGAFVSGFTMATLILLAIGLFRAPPLQPSLPMDVPECDWPVALMADQSRIDGIRFWVSISSHWPVETQSTVAKMVRDIAGYKSRCSELFVSEFPNLSKEDRTFVRDRCRDFGKALDEQLKILVTYVVSESLAESPSDSTEIRQQVHRSMSKIISEFEQSLQTSNSSQENI